MKLGQTALTLHRGTSRGCLQGFVSTPATDEDPGNQTRVFSGSASGSRQAVAQLDESSAVKNSPLPPGLALKPYSALPGPKGLPLIGCLWNYMKKDGYRFNKMFEAMQDLALQFGPVFREDIALISHVVVSDPQEYAKVIRVDGRTPHRVELEPMVHYRKKRGMSLGTVNSQGEEWYRNRMAVAKKTLRPNEIIDFLPAMNQVGNDFMTRMRKLLTPQGHVEELEHEIFKWAFESIGTFLFDERIGCLDDNPGPEAKEFLDNLVGFFKYMQPLMYNLPVYKVYPTRMWRLYEQHADRVTAIGMRYINKKIADLEKQGFQKNDKVTSLLTYFLANEALTPLEANSHSLDVMMGGVETTANSTLWTLYLLAKNPEAQSALYEETQRLVPQGQLTTDKLAELQYVKACLKETFRLYPITFATSRVIHQDIELCGYHVPAGTHVQANLYGMGRDPAIFTDPLVYYPERWLRENTDRSVQAMASLPWGHGPRMCLGRRLAEQEIYIALTKVIHNFRIEYHEDDVLPVLNTVMTPDRPVKLTFIPRDK